MGELDANRVVATAADVDFTDAFDLRQFLSQHGGGGVIQFGGGRCPTKRVDQDRRRGGVELAVGGIARDEVGRSARGLDRSLDVVRGAVDVATDTELQIDARGAEQLTSSR